MEESLENFLLTFIPKVASKYKALNQMTWILHTTGSKDAAEMTAQFDADYKMMFNDKKIYEKLVKWQKTNKDVIKRRELSSLIRAFKEYVAPNDLLNEISIEESKLNQKYSNFRPEFEGKKLTENDFRNFYKNEKDVSKRKQIWEKSKEIGNQLAPGILKLVKLRNEVAKHLGYENFYKMQLDLQEIDEKKLDALFSDLLNKTEKTYSKLIDDIDNFLMKKFNVSKDELGPWAWTNAFCQTDPMESEHIDQFVKGKDILNISKEFYTKMNMKIDAIIASSDLYEKEGKNQHAFCINIDKKKDVRTLNNIKDNSYWLGTLLHEFGHGVYEIGINENLPWLLRSPPHMLTTEALAMLMGRQIYKPQFLIEFLDVPESNKEIFNQIVDGLKRQQLILARFIIVINEFEKELYKNPSQNLNDLWWDLVEKYQKIKKPSNRSDKQDWAAKYHIGLAPVYCYSYLMGDLFASMINEKVKEISKNNAIWDKDFGKFLNDKLFYPGASMKWDELIENLSGKQLSCDAWIKEFCE